MDNEKTEKTEKTVTKVWTKEDVVIHAASILAAEVYRDLVSLTRVQLGIETGNISEITDKSRRDLSRLGYDLLPLASYMAEEEYDLTFGESSIKLVSLSVDRTEATFTVNIMDGTSMEILKFRDDADEAWIHADLRVWRECSSFKTDLTIRFVTVKKKQNTLSLMGC